MSRILQARKLAFVVGNELTDTQQRLLTTHYHAPRHTATAAWIGKRMGGWSYRSVNAQYGRMAHIISDLMGWKRPFWPNAMGHKYPWVGNVFDWTSPYSLDHNGHVRFEMFPHMRQALRDAGLV